MIFSCEIAVSEMAVSQPKGGIYVPYKLYQNFSPFSIDFRTVGVCGADCGFEKSAKMDKNPSFSLIFQIYFGL